MASKEKDNKALEKLKQFFRVTKQNPANYRSRADYTLSAELEKELGPESPINQRLRAIRDLCDIVLVHRLEDFGLERIWKQIKDLLEPAVDIEHRHAAFNFLKCLVQGQYEKLGMMRVYFFQFIKKHDVPEDVVLCFELLQTITNEGRDIQHLEDEFGTFLAGWLTTIAGAGKIVDYLDLFINFIKCNAAYVEEADIFNIVQSACFISCYSQDNQAVVSSLKVLATIVCYSELPITSLREFVSTLCRKINASDVAPTCWKVMRDLLGTHMGHATMYTLCSFLQDSNSYNDYLLLRGAVFYVHMGLWSEKSVPNLKCTPTSVLPSLLQVLESRHSLVVYEVILCIKRLVDAHGLELHNASWDIVLDILTRIISYVEEAEQLPKLPSPPESMNDLISSISLKLHETLTTIEQLVELGQYNGSIERVFDILESCSKVRPESSVLRLINYLAGFIKPTVVEWLAKLDVLVDRYYKQETRPNIRIKVIEVVSKVLSKYRYVYEEEIVERVILTYLTYVEMETELCVRNAVAQLLIAVCLESDSKKGLDVLSILEKLLNRPFDSNVQGLLTEGDVLDVKTVASGLIRVFQAKISHTPACHATKTYMILVGHLESHYQNPGKLAFLHSVHLMIFELLLKLRVNMLGQIGLVEPGGVRYSPYLVVERVATGGGSSAPPSPAPIPFSLSSTTKIIVTALGNEKDWRILSLLLLELPNLLQNKALIADRSGADVGPLAEALCTMVLNLHSLSLPDQLKNAPPKMNKTELQSHVYPVIAAISAYHAYLEPNQQVRCIKCLEYGLASRCAAKCVLAITTCTLEMKEAMYKLLPEVLLNLSKISATVVISIPILEFLSTLTSLPKVFASFVGDQYMSVFAIALPYTNPFKYNHYTVSLAHHVIAVWFLKCRLPFRRDFVKFITNGLKANILLPFEESQKSDLASLNEDSTNRKRSSSLTEQGSRRRDRPLPNTRLTASDLRHPHDEAQSNFHSELTETCIDLMARYTFSSCGSRPTRSSTAEFLLSGGQEQTWLLGHKLVTVTTSGCLQKPLKNNLCERCWVYCRIDRGPPSPEPEKEEPKTKTAEEETDDKPESKETLMERLLYGMSDELKPVRDVCTCWCQGWVEIWVRRPTGDMSWIMRLENELHPGAPLDPQSLSDISALFVTTHLPLSSSKRSSSSLTTNLDDSSDGEISAASQVPGGQATTSHQGSRESLQEVPKEDKGGKDDEGGEGDDEDECSDYDPVNFYPPKSQPTPILGGKSRNPVRRSNSSPEMSASWKNPFMKDKGTSSHDDSPKARVSCEAIPEEMTPPDAPTILTLPPRQDPRDLRLDVHVKSAKGLSQSGDSGTDETSALPSVPFTRDRSRTISVMSPTRYRHELEKTKPHVSRSKEAPKSGISPSFVFLQLFHSSFFGCTEEKPLLISNDVVIQRAITTLDRIQPFETHKVGVVYVGPGQAGIEAEILGNEFGSLRYAAFLQSLGTLINLKNADSQTIFLGGLDYKSGVDGKFAYIWQDDVTQVVFHVATLMPNKESDPNSNAKKLHIGNDFVTIVYNESGEEYKFIKMGQFNYASVVIQPLDLGSNKVTVKARPELADLGHTESKIVSDENLPILARQLALHANLASQVYRSIEGKGNPYASNWLERLRQIKRLRKKVMNIEDTVEQPQKSKTPQTGQIDDFTEYT